ncbi:MAG: flagellar biosynthesis protein FlgA, partial [Opitutaceae bacterium]|nr:flagellar biosynthesis protein FlgA [Opitutaceae bacterium]
MIRFLYIFLLSCSVAAYASRVKDLTVIEGGRDNQLVGYGLVVGLAGDGDSNAATTLRSVANVLQRYGLTISPQDIKAKNVAAVMLTADLSA